MVSQLQFANFLIAIICQAFTTMQNREAKKDALTSDYPKEGFFAFLKRFGLTLIGAQALDKSSAETDEIEKELAEALGQIDQEEMLERLVQGIDEDEVAVDAREIKHLFDGDEKKARLFIDRICSLGNLAHVAESGRPGRPGC